MSRKRKQPNKIKTVYISGGMEGLSPAEINHYFKTAEKKLKALGLEVLSPIRGMSSAGGNFEANEQVHRDETDIKHSDLVLACPSNVSIGTHMEVYLARKICDIPVIIITTNPHIAEHCWIKVYASKIVSSLDDAILHIKNWYL